MSYCRISVFVGAWAALLVSRIAGSEPSVHLDPRGDALPPGATARLGTDRFRPGQTSCTCTLSPDGKTLATGEPGFVRLWEMETGKELLSVPCPRAVSAPAIVFSSDSKHFAASMDTHGWINRPPWNEDVLCIGETATGKTRFIEPQLSSAYPLEFLCGGTVLAATLRGTRRIEGPQDVDVVLWNTDSGEELRRFPGACCFAPSPDGKLLAAGQLDGTIHLWNIATGEEQRAFKGHKAAVWALAFSPDGITLASAGGNQKPGFTFGEKEPEKEQDAAVHMWDVKSGEERRRCPGHDEPVKQLVFAADGRTLYAIDTANALRVWDAASGHSNLIIAGAKDSYCRAAFSPDGKTLVWGGRDGVLHEWTIAKAAETRQWNVDQEWGWRFAFTPDGKTLVCAGSPMRIWDVAAGKERFSHDGHQSAVTSLQFSPDGKMLATMDVERNLRLWETGAGKPLPLPADASRAQLRFGISADGRRLSAVGRDLILRVCETATGKELARADIGTDVLRERLSDFTAGIQSDLLEWADWAIIVSSDGSRLAVSDAAHVIHVWDVFAAKEVCLLKGRQGFATRMAFFPDGKKLISQDGGDIHVWDAEKGEDLRRFSDEPGRKPFFALSADGATLAWGAGRVVHLWAAVHGKEKHDLADQETLISSVAFSRDGKLFASVDKEETVRLWDVAVGKCLRTTTGDWKEFSFHNVKLLAVPGGRLLAEASEDAFNTRNGLRDLSSGRDLHVLSPWEHEQFAFSPDGRTLAVGMAEVALLDPATGKERCWLPPGHRGHLTALAFSPDGKTLATGGSDGNILLWDASALGGDGPPQLFHLSARELKARWDDLALEDASVAQHELIGSFQEAIPFLRQQLRSVPVVDPRPIARWIADLDADDFETRENATQKLANVSKLAERDLGKALRGGPSPELRRRGETLLALCQAETALPPESLRALRAIGVLELLKTPEARQALEELAGGPEGAWLTRQAGEALKRKTSAVPAP